MLDGARPANVHGGEIPELGEQPEAGKRVSVVTTLRCSGSRCLSRRTRESGNATKKSPRQWQKWMTRAYVRLREITMMLEISRVQAPL